MDYKDLFLALIVIAVSASAFVGISSDINSSWGTNITTGLDTEVSEIQLAVTGNLTNTAQQAQERGSAELGAGSADSQDNLYTQALRVIRTVPTLAGLPGKFIDMAGNALGAPSWITQLFKYLFNFVFWITFAYLLLLGVQKLF